MHYLNTAIYRRLSWLPGLALALSLTTHQLAAEDEGLSAMVGLLKSSEDSAFCLDIMRGMREGLRGRKGVKPPRNWKAAYTKLAKSKSAEVREEALLLALDFNDPNALNSLRHTLSDKAAKNDSRLKALNTLTEKRVAGLAPLLLDLLDDPKLRRPALRGLAAYKHKDTAKQVLARYSGFNAATRQDAVNLLAARPEWALSLLDAVAAKKLPRSDISAFSARQIRSLGDAKLSKRIETVWGSLRQTDKQKQKQILRYKKMFSKSKLAKADTGRGRLLFNRSCLSCHKLFGEGGIIGPELTGSDRRNLDYILENILDPSAAIGLDYQLNTVTMKNKQVITGIISEESTGSITLQSINQKHVLSRADIKSITVLPVSMMPEGLVLAFKDTEFRDLVAYLASPRQVPLPKDGKK